MNYYKRHIGDYMKDAAHLSLLEHGVYMRLLDVYYTRESAIPVGQAARLISARSRDEKEALAVVTGEFFVVVDGCFSQARCDREIAIAREFGEEADERKANETERQQRHRARRKEMFEALRERGVVPAWDASIEKLKRLLDMPVTPPVTFQVTPPVTLPVTARNAPETAIANSQKPIANNQEYKGELPDQPPSAPDVAARPSMAGAVCVAMKAAGLASVNPSHPELLALIDKGADIGLFASVAQECVGKGKGFAYVLATVRGRMADAAALADAALALPQQAATETAYQRSMRERYEEATGTGPARRASSANDITDIATKVLEIAP